MYLINGKLGLLGGKIPLVKGRDRAGHGGRGVEEQPRVSGDGMMVCGILVSEWGRLGVGI